MLDYAEYTIDSDGYQGNGHNGYDKLDGDWLTYYKVARSFIGKVKPEDKEDFLNDLFLKFARVNFFETFFCAYKDRLSHSR